jgi:hypothetical protein
LGVLKLAWGGVRSVKRKIKGVWIWQSELKNISIHNFPTVLLNNYSDFLFFE